MLENKIVIHMDRSRKLEKLMLLIECDEIEKEASQFLLSQLVRPNMC